MPDFQTFDQRAYRTVPARDGYRAWQPTYDQSVEDIMDLGVLDRVGTVRWDEAREVVDLGCGTGRTAAWLVSRSSSVAAIDGVDFTKEMLEAAERRGLHRSLHEADARATGLPGGVYDVAICSLVDEHLPELDSLYREAHRLLGPHGTFVLVGYHPFFIMASGMPTHFDGPDGEPVAIETWVHLPGEHLAAARSAGFAAVELCEAVIDDEWIARKPKWERFRDWPVSFAWVWQAVRPDR